ncbi:PepSY-associated TM helix [compost metagenome]|nr:PepSY domain-containing protein [Paenibacillus stellifer]
MLKILRLIHKMAGLAGALLIVFMAVTGLLLNHREWIGYNTGREMELQKLIFALHSGAVGGGAFRWLTDIAAICMIVLSVTGTWMWFRGAAAARRAKRRNRL